MADTKTPNAVMSILCSDLWTWSPDDDCVVKFKEDGTGELVCSVEFNIFIASEFDWELRTKAADIANDLPGDLKIAMTLTKRDFKDNPAPIKHLALTDAAFRQKTYQLRVEKGRFKVQGRTTYGVNPTYAYRLTWDKSPYPPLDEWNNKLAAKAGAYYERNDFYKEMIEDAEEAPQTA